MRKISVLLCLGLLFILGCSREDEKDLPTKQDQLSVDAYQVKVKEMQRIFSNYGWSEDRQVPYDYNDPKNRREIEKLDLKELEDFLREFSSDEGLKNLDEQLNIEKSAQEPKESNPLGKVDWTTKAVNSYSVSGSHSSSVIGSSTSLVNFSIKDNEVITFSSASATYNNANVSFVQVNGHNIIPFYPNANQDYYDHKGGINVDCKVKAYGQTATATMYARFNRNGSGSVESFRI
ncbi:MULTISPECIES: hypothetical protein [unclassified Myroides]|uniref:hypothetical protein n=1 Tax=unclassified Myroides TaxID=2642485 RepID=UPI003D2F5D27